MRFESTYWWVTCLRLNETPVSSDINGWFEKAVPAARDLIAESLPHVADSTGNRTRLNNVLGAFASCHGNAPLASLLFELEAGGFQCDKCKAFVDPMESTMNAFWNDPNAT